MRRSRREQRWPHDPVEKGVYVLDCEDCGKRISTSFDGTRNAFHRNHAEHQTSETYYDR